MSRPSTTAPDAAGATRRELLRLSALLGGVAATSGITWAIGPGRPDFGGAETIYKGEYPLDMPANIVTTTCLGCHAACPVRASREVGIVAKLDGNPWSPRVYAGRPPAHAEEAARRRGAICARGQARLQNTHDPNRIVKPLFREGPRGGGHWRSGDENTLATWLTSPEGLALRGRVVVAADPRQVDRLPVLAAFAAAHPRAEVHLGHSAPWLVAASERIVGQPGWLLAPRFERSTAFLAWGADPLASGLDPVGDAAALLRRRSLFQRRPVLVVDPRLSETAAKADLWLPVRPGGDLALVWMILRSWHNDGHVTLPPDWVEALTVFPLAELEYQAGIGREMAERAASILAEAGPGLAIRVGGGVGERAGGDDVATAILRLAALRGATGPKGAMEPWSLPPVLGERPSEALRRILVDGNGVIDALVIVGDAGLAEAPGRDEILAAIKDPSRVKTLIAIGTAFDPLSVLAYVIVPDITELERDGLVVRHDGTSLVRPVVPSILAETGMSEPWARGLPGFLQAAADSVGAPYDPEIALADAIAAVGGGVALVERGWVPPRVVAPTPTPAPIAGPLEHVLVAPRESLALVTWRESFDGHVDSLAQYWATPSFRKENRAWVHPTTAETLKVTENGLVRLTRDTVTVVAIAHVTEEIRPGVIGLAVGYGHSAGYDGLTSIDGEEVPADPRHTRGVDTASLARFDGDIVAATGGDKPRPSFFELIAAPDGTCNRI